MLRPIEALLWGWLAAAIVMAGLWLLQRARRDASSVDVGWTYSLGLLGVFYAIAAGGDPGRRTLLAIAIGGWSLRLGTHLLLDRIVGKPEDGRYQALRAHWGERAQPYFFLFFQGQALGAVIFSIPLLVVAYTGRPGLDAWDIAGAATVAVSVIGESIADRQLARFRADPANRGRTCKVGLWRTSRHPNYFFEWLHWWAYPLLAFSSPYVWLTLIGPAVMLALLFKVTGIPHTEAQAARSRSDYAEYQRTTSAFVPWFPRKERA